MIEIDYDLYKQYLRITKRGEKLYIYDPVRKKELVLQPEELVRQLTLQYLLVEKGYKIGQIRIEKGLRLHQLAKRCDIIVYGPGIQPFLLVECKSRSEPLNQKVFDQIARYNMPLKAPYLMVTNGMVTFACFIDHELGEYRFIKEIPDLKK